MKRVSGFTLVEMMVILVILTILAMVAVPSYLDKIVRAQVEAGLPLSDIAKRAISTYWGATQKMPQDNEIAALPAAEKIVGNYISALTVKDGVINLTFGNRASKTLEGKILSIRPAIVEDAPMVPIAWVCGLAEAPDNMTLLGNNQTNIDPMYLPMECRAIKGSS
jgi:type IV pilus assembly protein PilA